MEDAYYLIHWHVIVGPIEMISKETHCRDENQHYDFETSKGSVLQKEKDYQKYQFDEHHNDFDFC
jgi:hypothetical protein